MDCFPWLQGLADEATKKDSRIVGILDECGDPGQPFSDKHLELCF